MSFSVNASELIENAKVTHNILTSLSFLQNDEIDIENVHEY